MARGEMPFEQLLLLTAHQADEVIFAHRAAHQNSGLRPCRYGLRWNADLSQAACHRSDDDFELCGRDPVAGDVCRNNFRSQLQKVASVQGLAYCLLQADTIVRRLLDYCEPTYTHSLAHDPKQHAEAFSNLDLESSYPVLRRHRCASTPPSFLP
jgi:hypothetical protein